MADNTAIDVSPEGELERVDLTGMEWLKKRVEKNS